MPEFSAMDKHTSALEALGVDPANAPPPLTQTFKEYTGGGVDDPSIPNISAGPTPQELQRSTDINMKGLDGLLSGGLPPTKPITFGP